MIDGYNDREGDVTGDTAPERLVYLPKSRTIEVRDRSGARVGAVTTPYHVTTFGTVEAADGSSRLVVYWYPNASQGATYAVFDRELRPEAQWDEFPATSRFATTIWRGSPAVFYLQGDVLVGRDPDGRLLTRLPVPGGRDQGCSCAGGKQTCVSWRATDIS